MAPPMADEFYEKYKHLSHQELYQMLRAGVPRQVDSVADSWATVASTLSGLADSLRQDMDRLLDGWSGSASEEVAEGWGALVRRAKILAEEATGMRTGLTAMAQALNTARHQAEAPQEVPAVVQAAAQTVTFVLGSELGHLPTPEELARARERMVWLVARLAAQYGIADHANWPAMAVLPVALMGSATAVVQGHGHGHGHGHGDRHHRRGSRLESVGDLSRHHRVLPSVVSPLTSHGVVQPHGLTQTSAESAGALRGAGNAPRNPSVHIVGSTPAGPLPSADTHTPTAASATASPPPPPVAPMGLGAGAMPGGGGSVIGGGATTSGMGPGGTFAGGGHLGDVAWQTSDNVEWIDPDDAAPSVIGG